MRVRTRTRPPECHTANGPFTLVPEEELPGQRSSLVLGARSQSAASLATQRNDEELSVEVSERRAHSAVRARSTSNPAAESFLFRCKLRAPLRVGVSSSSAKQRTSCRQSDAQGLNLGLRDGATVAEIVADARRQNRDVGSPDVIRQYDTQRGADITSRTIAVDRFEPYSLLTDFLPAQGARGLSLFLMDRIGPLRRAVMREGATPSVSQPRLMRGEML